jgi:exodeoxyribonuclease III
MIFATLLEPIVIYCQFIVYQLHSVLNIHLTAMDKFLIKRGPPQARARVQVQTRPTQQIAASPSSLQPVKFCSWNCNGFSVRLNTENAQNLNAFVEFIEAEQPDVITLQEVRMIRSSNQTCGTIHHAKKSPKCLRTDAELFALFKKRIPGYAVHLSLADKKYAGQAILVRKTLQPPTIRYTFDPNSHPSIHDADGRIIIAEFEHVVVVSTYTPNNGSTDEKLQRRRDWDYRLDTFLTSQRKNTFKAVVYQGDLNVAAENADMSGDPLWWRTMSQGAFDPRDDGQSGTTVNEQQRFQNICISAGLVDAWRCMHPQHAQPEPIDNPNFTWRGATGRYFGKGLRLDYILVCEQLIEKGLVESAVICGSGVDLRGFMGSDHCPIMLTLVDKWWTK